MAPQTDRTSKTTPISRGRIIPKTTTGGMILARETGTAGEEEAAVEVGAAGATLITTIKN